MSTGLRKYRVSQPFTWEMVGWAPIALDPCAAEKRLDSPKFLTVSGAVLEILVSEGRICPMEMRKYHFGGEHGDLK